MTEKITVQYYNDVYMQIDADMGIMQEIHEHFMFKVPNYQFHPRYKNKMWDGNIRLFNTRNGMLYVGLLDKLKTFAHRSGYEMVIDSILAPSFKMPIEDVDKYIKEELNPHIIDKKTNTAIAIEPYKYQVYGVQTVLENERKLLLSATGSGKSLIAYTLARMFTDKRCFFEDSGEKKVLIVVPTTSLVEQLYSDFDEYALKDTKWNAEDNIHKIYAGKEKVSNKEIWITTWQSVYKLDVDFFSQFGMVIVDEAHLAKADSIKGIMEKLPRCPFKIGMTGTLDGTQCNSMVLEGLFGKVERIISAREMIDEGHASQLEIFGIVLNWSARYVESLKDSCLNSKGKRRKILFQDELNWLYSLVKRNNFIANLAVKQTSNTLILYNYVEKHGRPLYELIKTKVGDDRKVYFIHGGTKVGVREEIRKAVESDSDAIIVASYGTFSTGINIRRIHNIIFASSYKAQIKVLQSIGRGLRKADEKEKITLYDVTDDVSIGKKSNYTLQHFFERIKIYDKEKFTYKLIKVDLD